jgi:hypothetical protein
MVARLQQLLSRLDAFGADDPDNNAYARPEWIILP